MDVISSVAKLRERLATERSVGFVPTMGNLHEGHLDLVRAARTHARCVVVSIFVNRLQFGPREDFDRYPRTLESDLAKLAGLAEVVFAPTEADLYPSPQEFLVEPPAIANELCGAFRPGHFRGVATVVLKLFNIVRPDVAVFGKKDYQQLHVIRAMVKQLAVPVRILGHETRREADGLAMSSRNQYLSAADRGRATALYEVLRQLRADLEAGRRDYSILESEGRERLDKAGFRVDYVAVRKASDLQVPGPDDRPLVVLAAASLGATRLIDNLEACLAG